MRRRKNSVSRFTGNCPRFTPFHVSFQRRPRKDQRGFNLISDVLPFGRLWYGGPNSVSNAIGYAQLTRWFGILCVLAIPLWPRLRHAQAREEEAETL
jgi:hypothetical protein